jgi:hypothetical protein
LKYEIVLCYKNEKVKYNVKPCLRFKISIKRKANSLKPSDDCNWSRVVLETLTVAELVKKFPDVTESEGVFAVTPKALEPPSGSRSNNHQEGLTKFKALL